MGQECRRHLGVQAKVCLLLALALSVLWPSTGRAAPFELAGSEQELGVVIYPAQRPGPRRVTVLLHGMCGEPRNTCSHFAALVTENEHLICPRANRRCDGGGASWPASGFEQPIERALARAEAELGELVDAAPGRTLIGYSLGAYRALDLAQHGAGRYPRVMLIGAKINANQRLLRESGVQRLLLSAGAWDMTYPFMQRESERLRRQGVAARFLGLGPVGHGFTPSLAQYLPAALAWLDAEPVG